MQNSNDNIPTLYLVPTPIGNLDDITKRSLDILKEVNVILCEDTRTTSILLKQYNINKKLISCHLFNENKIKEKVVDELIKNKKIALVSDQGSPIISDPGYIVTKYLIDLGYNVVALPGATAFVPALMVSGLPADHFMYYGFLNSKASKRVKELKKLERFPFTMIFYEAPHRIIKTLNDMLDVFGDRNIAIVREISKIYEEVIRGKISECLDKLYVVKGEFVIVVTGFTDKENFDDLSILEHVNLYINDGYKSTDAIKKVAIDRGVSKSVIYKEYLEKKEK